jgi:hypothetical protein
MNLELSPEEKSMLEEIRSALARGRQIKKATAIQK